MGLPSQLGSRKKPILRRRMGYCLESRDGEIAAPAAKRGEGQEGREEVVICTVEVDWRPA
jgi:hypothetical protein